MSDPTKKSMTVAEAGKKGGDTVMRKHGTEFYARIGSAGGNATKASQGADFYQRIGKIGATKGGNATKAAHGQGHFERIGKMGGARVKQLVADGKKAEEERREKSAD